MQSLTFTSLPHHTSPALPFRNPFKTYAAYPVWSGSTTKALRFEPITKAQAVKLWHRARDFDRATRQPGRHGGSIGHTALQVLHALIFDFLNYRTGRLDPSYAAIARKANVCERSVAYALQRLKSLGILNWVRRCAESWKDGRFVLEQQTNAYAVMPSGQWLGYREPVEAPPPHPGTWGDHPPLPSVLAQAGDVKGDLAAAARVLSADEHDSLAQMLARLAQTMHEQEGRKA